MRVSPALEGTVKEVLTVLAGVLFVAGFLPYVRAILRKETVPSKASWLIWAALDTLTLVGMLAAESVNGQIVGAVLGAWIVAILAFKFGTTAWSKLDLACIVIAFIGVLGWQTTNDPVFAIVASSIAVLAGAVPTIVSAWKDPSKEDRVAWTIFWLSCVCAMLAIPQWTPEDAVQPSVFFAIETVMVAILYFKPRIRPRAA